VDEVERAAHFEHLRLPTDLDYAQVPALSFEVRQRLAKFRPETLGQASRMQGITPAAVSLLLVHLKKGKFKGFATLPAGLPGASKFDLPAQSLAPTAENTPAGTPPAQAA
jgi:tRNA uridine 5-carboxymethylaminomethyl modification enzyme